MNSGWRDASDWDRSLTQQDSKGGCPGLWPSPNHLMASGLMFGFLSTGSGCGDVSHNRWLHGSSRMGLIPLGEL